MNTQTGNIGGNPSVDSLLVILEEHFSGVRHLSGTVGICDSVYVMKI